MLFNFDELVKKHNMQMTGVIHIGAHECGEILNYVQHKIPNGILIEANPSRCENLRRTIQYGCYPEQCYPQVRYLRLTPEQAAISRNYTVWNYIVTDKTDKPIELNISTFDGGVDSIFKINEFGVSSSWAPYKHVGAILVDTISLDDLMTGQIEEYNFINLDIEGAELLALRGGEKTLKERIKYIMCETQEKSRFDGSCLASEVTDYLATLGFKLVDYFDTGKQWGDALYIKE